MGQQQIQLLVDDEVKALGDALRILLVDLKAKKAAGVILSDAVAPLIAAVGGISNFGADIKKGDNQVYLVKAIVDALEPVVVPA